MTLPREVEERFERIEKHIEESWRLHEEGKKEFNREVRFLVDILRETLTHSRESTKRLDKLEVDLSVSEKVKQAA